MGLLAHLQPREPVLAARVLSTLAAVAGGVTVLFAAITPTQQHATPLSVSITVATALGVVAVAVLLRRMRNRGRWVWALFPFVATAAIAALDLLTRDSSVSAQIFFLFPALYAAFQLRRTGAALVGTYTIAGDLLVVFTLLPARIAVVQCGYLAAAIAATMALLVHAGDRQDALVAELRHLAAIDSLTGLVNRRVLDEAAASALCGAASELGTGLILLDVDQFKDVNDRFGHPAGDQVLVQLAERLKHGTRGSDTISRMGGDEIAILLPGCGLRTVIERAESIVRDVRTDPFTLSTGERLVVSVSIGVAHLPTHGVDLRSLYHAADASLYAAKRGGRDQVGPTPDELQAA
jgi:diguanylate cyclase (GGDEF)-like protein